MEDKKLKSRSLNSLKSKRRNITIVIVGLFIIVLGIIAYGKIFAGNISLPHTDKQWVKISEFSGNGSSREGYLSNRQFGNRLTNAFSNRGNLKANGNDGENSPTFRFTSNHARLSYTVTGKFPLVFGAEVWDDKINYPIASSHVETMKPGSAVVYFDKSPLEPAFNTQDNYYIHVFALDCKWNVTVEEKPGTITK